MQVEDHRNFWLFSFSQDVKIPYMWTLTYVEELRCGGAPKDENTDLALLIVSGCLENQVYSHTVLSIQTAEPFPNCRAGSVHSCPSTRVTFLPFLFSCCFCLPTTHFLTEPYIPLPAFLQQPEEVLIVQVQAGILGSCRLSCDKRPFESKSLMCALRVTPWMLGLLD